MNRYWIVPIGSLLMLAMLAEKRTTATMSVMARWPSAQRSAGV